MATSDNENCNCMQNDPQKYQAKLEKNFCSVFSGLMESLRKVPTLPGGIHDPPLKHTQFLAPPIRKNQSFFC